MAKDVREKKAAKGTKGNGRITRPLAKSAATRRRVLDAAAKVLMDRGYAATRLGDIAEYADLQAGSLYYYFDSKEQLVEEVLRYGVQFTHAHVRTAVDALPEDATPGDRLRTAVNSHLESMLEIGDLAPAHVRTFNQIPPEMQERLRPARRAFGKFWAELVEAAIDAGEVRSDLDPYILRLFIVNSIERVTEWHLRQRRSAEELAQIMRTMIFEGVGVGKSWGK
jgi:TetR/AcrR family transcriptional regulator, cholesterol catabolism regulator